VAHALRLKKCVGQKNIFLKFCFGGNFHSPRLPGEAAFKKFEFQPFKIFKNNFKFQHHDNARLKMVLRNSKPPEPRPCFRSAALRLVVGSAFLKSRRTFEVSA
jgi:hypothetical protein